MSITSDNIPQPVLEKFRRGTVIPAHPLALDKNRKLSTSHQRALTRYYLDAGAGGLAVGVYTTQFAIRAHGLYEPVLNLAAQTAQDWSAAPTFLIAGLAGKTEQAVHEAQTAMGIGYHAGMLNVAAMKGASENEILSHCKTVAANIPLIGFYLLPEVGGIKLSCDFWRRFSQLENVIGIKIAPFNRYGTLDVIHGVVDAKAEHRVTLYTGNDDHIVLDLLTPFTFSRGADQVSLHMNGGLLGHWCFWTRRAVETLERIHQAIASGSFEPDLLALDARTTDANGAIYDGINDLRGCVPGCYEILRRQGIMPGNWCLDPEEVLSPGQAEEIDRVCAAYPELNDDDFVRANLDRWLSD